MRGLQLGLGLGGVRFIGLRCGLLGRIGPKMGEAGRETGCAGRELGRREREFGPHEQAGFGPG